MRRYFSRFAMLIVALPFLSAFTAQAQTSPFDVADHKQIRVIISADAKNEADDDFAVAHAVLTPTMQVKGLIAAHYSRTAPLMKRDGEKQHDGELPRAPAADERNGKNGHSRLSRCDASAESRRWCACVE
nr:hypothetical protein KXZ65_02120 [Pectobacterium sp. PL152]